MVLGSPPLMLMMGFVAVAPRFRFFSALVGAAVVLCAPVLPVRADDELAGRIFLEGFLKRDAAMKAEAERDFQSAHQLYIEASRIYDRLAVEYPDWKPSIVQMRREGFAQEIQNVAGKAKQMEEGRPVPREPRGNQTVAGGVGAGTVPGSRPSPPVAGDLPRWENRNPGAARVLPSGPGVTIRPPVESAPAEDAGRIAAPLQRRIDALESLLAASNRERDALKESLARTETRRQRAEQELEQARADRRSLGEQLAALREEKVNDAVAATARDERIAAMEKELESMNERIAESGSAAETARREAEEMKSFAEAARRERDRMEVDLKAALAQVDTLRIERDALALVLIERGAAGDQVVAGVAQRFEKELEEAREQIARLSEAQTRDAETIAGLRAQLAGVESELASARREAAESQTMLAKLRDQLESTREALAARGAASVADASGDERLAEENLVLREIVIRQLRQQTYRARARELLLAEMAKMEIDSKSMLALLDQLEGKEAIPDASQIARVRDPYIEALAGVGMSARFFLGQGENEAGETDGLEVDDGDGLADGGAAREPGDDLGAAGDFDVREAFEFQKRSLAETAARAFEAGEFAAAEETYRLIVQADPGDPRMICNLGVAVLRQERFSDALQIFHQALSVREQDAYAHLMMGVCHWKLGQYRLASDRIHRSLTLQPDNPLGWVHLGLVASSAEDYPAAESAFKRALEIDPEYAPAHYNLAVIHTRPGYADPPEAARRYERAVRLGSPRDPALEDFLRLGPDGVPGVDF